MSNSQIIALVVAVVVVLAIAAIVVAALRSRSKRQEAERREVAGQLRHEAAAKTADVQRSELEVKEAEAQAEVARLQAARAEQDAASVRQSAAVDQARQEDVVREADRLDPDVDHRADDYRPETGSLVDPQPAPDPTATHAGTTPAPADVPSTPPRTFGEGADGPTHRA